MASEGTKRNSWPKYFWKSLLVYNLPQSWIFAFSTEAILLNVSTLIAISQKKNLHWYVIVFATQCQYQVQNDELLNNETWDLGKWVSIYLLLNILENNLNPDNVSGGTDNLRITFSYKCLTLDFLIVCLNRPETAFFPLVGCLTSHFCSSFLFFSLLHFCLSGLACFTVISVLKLLG